MRSASSCWSINTWESRAAFSAASRRFRSRRSMTDWRTRAITSFTDMPLIRQSRARA